jgi:hypothetical protein
VTITYDTTVAMKPRSIIANFVWRDFVWEALEGVVVDVQSSSHAGEIVLLSTHELSRAN